MTQPERATMPPKKGKTTRKKPEKKNDIYHGTLSSIEAANKLSQKKVKLGQYLLRSHPHKPQFVLLLSVRIDSDRIAHFPIKGDFASEVVYLCPECGVDDDGEISTFTLQTQLNHPYSFGFDSIPTLCYELGPNGKYASIASSVIHCCLTSAVKPPNDVNSNLEDAGGLGLFRSPSGRKTLSNTSSLTGKGRVGNAMLGTRPPMQVRMDSGVSDLYKGAPRAVATQQIPSNVGSKSLVQKESSDIKAAKFDWVNKTGIKELGSGHGWAAKLLKVKKPGPFDNGKFVIRSHKAEDEYILTVIETEEFKEYRVVINPYIPVASRINGRDYGPFKSIEEVVWILGMIVRPKDAVTGVAFPVRLRFGYDAKNKTVAEISPKLHKPSELCHRDDVASRNIVGPARARSGSVAMGHLSNSTSGPSKQLNRSVSEGVIEKSSPPPIPHANTSAQSNTSSKRVRSNTVMGRPPKAATSKPLPDSKAKRQIQTSGSQKTRPVLRSKSEQPAASKSNYVVPTPPPRPSQSKGSFKTAWRQSTGNDDGVWAGEFRESLLVLDDASSRSSAISSDDGVWAGDTSRRGSIGSVDSGDYSGFGDAASDSETNGHEKVVEEAIPETAEKTTYGVVTKFPKKFQRRKSIINPDGSETTATKSTVHVTLPGKMDNATPVPSDTEEPEIDNQSEYGVVNTFAVKKLIQDEMGNGVRRRSGTIHLKLDQAIVTESHPNNEERPDDSSDSPGVEVYDDSIDVDDEYSSDEDEGSHIDIDDASSSITEAVSEATIVESSDRGSEGLSPLSTTSARPDHGEIYSGGVLSNSGSNQEGSDGEGHQSPIYGFGDADDLSDGEFC